MHGIHGDGPAACGSCGGPMRKALSAPTIHFKGSGWAKKDAQAATKSRNTPSPPEGAKGADAGGTDARGGSAAEASGADSDAGSGDGTAGTTAKKAAGTGAAD